MRLNLAGAGRLLEFGFKGKGMFFFELEEIHPECGTHYEMWKEQGIFFVYCPTCDKSWETCESAMRQYRQWCEEPLTEVLTSLRKK